MKKSLFKYGIICSAALFCLLVYTGHSIRFEDRFAHIVYADGKIIGGSVSEDEQWRIRCNDTLPAKLSTCIIAFEDQYFYLHPGVNPISILKALRDNFKAGKVVRGGSTLTMQLARIYQGNKERTYFQKVKELFYTLAIELSYSKQEILALYAQYAPFGGNTIGYCAASYRYYNKAPENLSWGAAATLAVLPNAPSDIYPGKGQLALVKKRNFLLSKLLNQGVIDAITFTLSVREPLPSGAEYFASEAPHVLQRFHDKSGTHSNLFTTIDHSLQVNVNRVVHRFYKEYSASGIDNIAILVIRNDGRIASYAGNSPCDTRDCGGDVDMLTSLRSPGSLLKPFLYAASLHEGLITPKSLLEDIPSFYNGYSPRNFDDKFRGIVDASTALTKSLNIPAVNLLSKYGVASFIDDLNAAGLYSINKTADHYGLSLILGGGEVTPLELGQGYMNLARTAKGLRPVYVLLNSESEVEYCDTDFPIGRGTAWLTLEMLKGVNRPSGQIGWKNFTGQKSISWKTGTSYGFRDAWSVGVTTDYTVVVWVGNADGEGVAGLTGVQKAAPVMFEVFNLLPAQNVISQPLKALKTVSLCSESGYIASRACSHTVIDYVPVSARNIPLCSYHKMIRPDSTGARRVDNLTEYFAQCTVKSVFYLDPVVSHYYKKHTGIDLSLPPTASDQVDAGADIAIVYPTRNARVMLTTDLGQNKQPLISKAISEYPGDTLHWFLDSRHLGTTRVDHAIQLEVEPGVHSLTIVSARGDRQSHSFTILEE